jgi:SAM-dependent methyltransferase
VITVREAAPEAAASGNPAGGAVDVARANQATYDAIAADYDRGSGGAGPAWHEAEIDWLAAELGPGALVADVGCGPGQAVRSMRARELRACGFDLSAGMLRTGGLPGMCQADMRALPLRSGVADAVWCAAALLHVPREDVARTLSGFARVLRPGGLLTFSVAEGAGEEWEPVSYASDLRRWYVYHDEADMTGLLAAAGFDVLGTQRCSTHRRWLHFRARRRAERDAGAVCCGGAFQAVFAPVHRAWS